MKGNDQLLQSLNVLLADELTAINQYMVHAEMCENWGYDKLSKAIKSQAMDEMHHAEWLIERILFLEGLPVVSELNAIHIGKDVPAIVAGDMDAEIEGIQHYNETITLSRQVQDQGTVELLSKILKMEEGHIDWAEAQRDQIEQMGLPQYLSNLSSGPEA
jgi:bacterioferritin